MNKAEFMLVNALRNGKYIQGFEALRLKTTSNKYKYCCLGVACNVLYNNPHWTLDEKSYWIGNNNSKLTKEITKKLQWNDSEGKLSIKSINGMPLNLAMLNDSREFTFDQIADIIQAGLILHKGDKYESY